MLRSHLELDEAARSPARPSALLTRPGLASSTQGEARWSRVDKAPHAPQPPLGRHQEVEVTEANVVESEGAGPDWRELVAVLLLAVTAVVTAWTGFQASKWGGAMSISFSQASSARIEAARLEGVANRKQTVQVSLFTQWLEAYQADDAELTDFLASRFPEPLASTFSAWIDTQPLKNPQAPATPFEMAAYVIPELGASRQADDRADKKFTEALRNNQRGDNYTVLTVAFATVLFFAALSGRMRSIRAQWAFLVLGCVGFLASAVLLVIFPKLI
jgi:hypothetical protein